MWKLPQSVFEILQSFTGEAYRVEWSSADWRSVATDVYDDESNILGRGLYIGITSGNGLADDAHFVGSLTVAPPIPEPSPGPCCWPVWVLPATQHAPAGTEYPAEVIFCGRAEPAFLS
ncbi:hypothetical protein BSY238_1151 [Methyloversatilis sp. RAC08]|uniref:hypothetical protein n=1 Tax=Methyloversatilis sp. RAC08 TaxID=1842540 RepID=UPI00083E2D2A|nr:hypothetical protein [Methyloversatilis sp. RAC08]AOF81074.1 hypothetical protein BSY238_1151 [Methyloversatilis sp. RAC08]